LKILQVLDIVIASNHAKFELCQSSSFGTAIFVSYKYPSSRLKLLNKSYFKNWKNSVYEHVSVQNDLTIAEQKQNYKLRQELRERKSKGEEVCIYNNTIILKADHPKNESSAAAKDNPQWLLINNCEPQMTNTATNMNETRKLTNEMPENKINKKQKNENEKIQKTSHEENKSKDFQVKEIKTNEDNFINECYVYKCRYNVK